jgi:hypothetical protein
VAHSVHIFDRHFAGSDKLRVVAHEVQNDHPEEFALNVPARGVFLGDTVRVTYRGDNGRECRSHRGAFKPTVILDAPQSRMLSKYAYTQGETGFIVTPSSSGQNGHLELCLSQPHQ